MSEYRRWISYIYAYENGEKKQNVGYARIELRNGKVRFHVHMNMPAREQLLTVCCYKMQGEKCDGVSLGEFSLTTGREEFRAEMAADNLAGSGLFFVEMSGLLLFEEGFAAGSPGKYYASSWEEEPLAVQYAGEIIRKVRGQREPAVEEQEKESEPVQSVYTVSVNEEESEAFEKSNPDMRLEEETEVPEALVSSEAAAIETQEWIEKPEPSAARNQCCSAGRENRPFCCLEAMYPFEDGEFDRSVRMEPQDIGMLPRSMWKYAGNSFLLHGFYTYHHLLLTRKRGKEGDVCYLLVPGTYGGREQHMAQMFGFRHFKSLKRKSLENGDFGYWYLEVPKE